MEGEGREGDWGTDGSNGGGRRTYGRWNRLISCTFLVCVVWRICLVGLVGL